MNVTVYIFVYFYHYLYYKETTVNKNSISQFTKNGLIFGFPANTLIRVGGVGALIIIIEFVINVHNYTDKQHITTTGQPTTCLPGVGKNCHFRPN